jgi:IQ motif/SEC7 domain-containing protein
MHRHHIPVHYQQQPQQGTLGQPQNYTTSIAIATGAPPASNPDTQFSSNSSSGQQQKTDSPLSTPLSNISPNLSSCSVSSSSPSSNNIKVGSTGNGSAVSSASAAPQMTDAECEIVRKRLYRVGLNMFNKKPETGITYLVKKKFLEGSAPAVARFLISRKGLSKQMIGEYLANLQSPFSMACLEHFASEIDLASMPIDLALRRFQTYLRMPGEAQKIERVMESFSRRYAACNPHLISQFRNGADTVFVMAFAIIMLNTDLHTPHLKQDRRMKMDDFIKNLRGIDDGGDIDRDILVGIYERIKQTEFKTGHDHVTQVMKVQQTIVGKKPNLALPHRRLVCYCRLYEVADINKREKTGSHQREVFLFNDILVLTKIFHKKRNSVTYSFRQSYPLQGITLALFANQHFEFGLSLKRGDTVLLNLNARNEHDRAKFTEDLREAIAESDEMARIENLSKENRDRDSGVDVGKIKRFSNSLLDINDQCKPTRRGSCGSLDSGMSVSFHSDEIHQQQLQQANHNIHLHHQNSQPSISLAISHPPLPQHSHQGSSCSSSSQSSHK